MAKAQSGRQSVVLRGLAAARAKAGVTQAALAEAANITERQLRNIEQGKTTKRSTATRVRRSLTKLANDVEIADLAIVAQAGSNYPPGATARAQAARRKKGAATPVRTDPDPATGGDGAAPSEDAPPGPSED